MSPLVVPATADEARAALRKSRDPRQRALLNDRYQRQRAGGRRATRRDRQTTLVPHACWRQRPRPRVTRLPERWSARSEKAQARHRRRGGKTVENVLTKGGVL